MSTLSTVRAEVRRLLADLDEKQFKRWSDKILFGDGCWEWTAAKTSDGYGRIEVDGKTQRAHRITWELFHGPIPDGMCVLHRCDNPGCVNPAHLWLGTKADNLADMTAKGRRRGGGPCGERSGRAKLTEEQALEILGAGGTQAAIAARYGISDVQVGRIKHRKRWVYLGGVA